MMHEWGKMERIIENVFKYMHMINNPYLIMDMEFNRFVLHNIRSLSFDFKRKVRNKIVYFWITPWGNTPTPWYTLILAALYKRYTAYNVKIILNDMWKGDSLGPYYTQIIKLIQSKSLFIKQCCHMELIKLSEVKSAKLTDEDIEILKEAVKQNTIKSLQTSFGSIRYEQRYSLWKKALYPMAERIKSLLENRSEDEFIIPGGGYEETGFLCQMCMKRCISFSTFDSGIKSMILGKDCVATWQGNTKEVYEYVNRMKRKDKVISMGFKILEERMNAKIDIASSYIDETVQICKRNEEHQSKFDIVIFPNIEHDTASLGTLLFFGDYVEWLTKSVKFILDETDARVAVREHPMQRKYGNKHTFDYLNRQFGKSERYKFYACDQDVNSYDLIAGAKLVIVSTSTIGMEAAMMGKRVITISNVFYGEAEFCVRCDNEKTYFDEILRAINVPVKLREDKINEAAIYYVLTQMCNWAVTDFTPHNQAYSKWTRMKVKDILNYEDTELLVKALISRQPLALLILKKRFENN